jgi:6-phosphogluconolactonase
MSQREEIVCADIEELGRRAAEEFTRIAGAATAASGRFSVALSGGNTPRALHTALAGAEFRGNVSWAAVHFFWGDERVVPPDHPDSNYRMAYETLLSKVSVPQENIHRVETELGAEGAAEAYEKTLRGFFADAGAAPRFDLLLLGIGDDGHTASLFPGSPALHEEKRWVVATYVEKLKSERVTLTLPVLNAAANVIFLVSGKAKAKPARETRSAGSELPAAQVRPAGKLLWILDRAAAALL